VAAQQEADSNITIPPDLYNASIWAPKMELGSCCWQILVSDNMNKAPSSAFEVIGHENKASSLNLRNKASPAS
jgi:hypothetical protein